MSVSWKAFFYGAFDPKATITIDKLAGEQQRGGHGVRLQRGGAVRDVVPRLGRVIRRGRGRGAAGGGPVGRVTPAGGRGAAQQYNAGGFLGRSGGWTKLADARFGPEIGWLYPLALLTLIAGLAWRGRARRTDPMRAGLVMWGTWLATFGVIYSVMSNIPHTAYMASLAMLAAPAAWSASVLDSRVRG